MNRCRAVLLFLVFCLPLSSQAQRTYFGEGVVRREAPVKNPGSLKELAFERARSSAAEKSGAYVLSLQSIRSAETERGFTESSTNKVATLAAAFVEEVEGSKNIQRGRDAGKVVFTAQARYEVKSQVSEEKFKEAVKTYLTGGTNPTLQRSLETAVVARRTLLNTEAGELESEQVRALLTQVRSAYSQVTSVALKMEGDEARERVERELSQRQKSLTRYLRVIKKHGHPHDVFDMSADDYEVQNRGSYAEVSVEVSISDNTDSAEQVAQTCQETRPTWAPGNPRDEDSFSDRPSDDRWTRKAFEGSMYRFGLVKDVHFYLVDSVDRVVSVVTIPSGGSMSPPSIVFEYGYCSVDSAFKIRSWKEEWRFQVPSGSLEDVEMLIPAVSSEDYSEALSDSGYDRPTRGVWVAPSESRRVPTDDLVYSRQTLTQLLNQVAERATSM
jgi:hypothetical protein